MVDMHTHLQWSGATHLSPRSRCGSCQMCGPDAEAWLPVSLDSAATSAPTQLLSTYDGTGSGTCGGQQASPDPAPLAGPAAEKR